MYKITTCTRHIHQQELMLNIKNSYIVPYNRTYINTPYNMEWPQSHISAYDFTGFWFYHFWWNTRYHRNFCLASLTMDTILVRVTRSSFLYVCFVDRFLSFHTFSFYHSVLCSYSIYRFWLPLRYLHTHLIIG
jgi:hypothetical protein